MAKKKATKKSQKVSEHQKIYDTHFEAIKEAITEAEMDRRLPTRELYNLMEEVERHVESVLGGLHDDLEAQDG